MDVFGATRARIRRNYALITPDTHVISTLIGWERATAVIHIAPQIGARFTQYMAILQAGGRSTVPGAAVERMVYLLDGEIAVDCPALQSDPLAKSLTKGGYAYFPAGAQHAMTATTPARLLV